MVIRCAARWFTRSPKPRVTVHLRMNRLACNGCSGHCDQAPRNKPTARQRSPLKPSDRICSRARFSAAATPPGSITGADGPGGSPGPSDDTGRDDSEGQYYESGTTSSSTDAARRRRIAELEARKRVRRLLCSCCVLRMHHLKLALR